MNTNIFTTKWIFNNGPIDEYANVRHQTSTTDVHVYPVHVNNSGDYACYGFNHFMYRPFLAFSRIEVIGMFHKTKDLRSILHG